MALQGHMSTGIFTSSRQRPRCTMHRHTCKVLTKTKGCHGIVCAGWHSVRSGCARWVYACSATQHVHCRTVQRRTLQSPTDPGMLSPPARRMAFASSLPA